MKSRQYAVRIIDDRELPPDVPWAYVRQADCLVFVLKRSVAEDAEAVAAALTDAWEAFRMIADDELLSWPEPKGTSIAC